ncbi:hypothetical protein PHLCEN_2v1738 [Hermanssonia centrifuga]|uniref:WW domain-containing protein n=1 Tax=Hermanssonia centrifuga TaxID=98765 RepID=A0A2R6RW21_9APHY|nr:hypothetical protein PHLCEN_2v1738 [Hermanssonia centrifuga]
MTTTTTQSSSSPSSPSHPPEPLDNQNNPLTSDNSRVEQGESAIAATANDPSLVSEADQESKNNNNAKSGNVGKSDPTKSTSPDEGGEASGSTAATPATANESGTGTPAAGDWQAIWSPLHNTYYFYNAATQETTWTNPLEQSSTSSSTSTSTPAAPADEAQPSTSTSASASTPASLASMYALQQAAADQGIDPSLAFLDPSLAAGPSNPAAFTYTAKFNARTGTFTRPDGRDPTHLSEYERAKRMSEAYFDVGAWEQDVEARNAEEEAEGKKRKRPTKKDLERFKEQKRLKKIAKTAWLRT